MSKYTPFSIAQESLESHFSHFDLILGRHQGKNNSTLGMGFRVCNRRFFPVDFAKLWPGSNQGTPLSANIVLVLSAAVLVLVIDDFVNCYVEYDYEYHLDKSGLSTSTRIHLVGCYPK